VKSETCNEEDEDEEEKGDERRRRRRRILEVTTEAEPLLPGRRGQSQFSIP
jgi:hypothetical protein